MIGPAVPSRNESSTASSVISMPASMPWAAAATRALNPAAPTATKLPRYAISRVDVRDRSTSTRKVGPFEEKVHG